MSADGPFANVRGRNAVDHALRAEQMALGQLNQMADTKANIMITVSSIVLSISFSQFGEASLRMPLMTLAGFSLLALILAVLAVLPKYVYPKRADGSLDKDSPQFNLLFFGHFTYMPLEEFKRDMAKTLEEDALLYERVVADIYGAGVVLERKKYRFLRYSYLCFLAGASITCVEFLAMLILY